MPRSFEVKARRVNDFDVLETENVPGTFMFTTRYDADGHAGMIFVCPCGCGELGSLSFLNAKDDHPRWSWNGDEDKPTLKPSIMKTTGCKWHGWLTEGVFHT